MHRLTPLVLLIIIALGAWFRAPLISYGLPYFYDEDEAHHFDHLVDMAARHDINPHYFNKPSLHFYLRLPILYGAIAVEKVNGGLRSIKEIRTHDKFGIAGYALSTTHPSIAKAVRSVSFLASLGIILLTFLIGRELSEGDARPLLASAIVAISPPLIEQSSLVGVDTLMAALSLCAVYYSLITYRSFSLKNLTLLSILCGLAISTKYTAAPIAILPLLVCWRTSHLSSKSIALALLIPPLAFLAGTPYLIVELQTFYENVRYEILHYRVLGHEGHTEEPGLPQLLFYLRWFAHEGVGYLTLVASLFGVCALIRKAPQKALLALAFPLLFFTMMVFQKVNFTRNMLVMIPFLSLFGAFALSKIPTKNPVLFSITSILVILQPLQGATHDRISRSEQRESRIEVEEWYHTLPETQSDTAIEGTLQFSNLFLRLPGVEALSLSSRTTESLYNDGYDRLIVPASWPVGPSASLEKDLSAREEPGRVVKNPSLKIYRLSSASEAFSDKTTLPLELSVGVSPLPCASKAEPYCWINKRNAALKVAPALERGTLTFEVMTPWDRQTIVIEGKKRTQFTFPSGTAGTWQTVKTSELATTNSAVNLNISISDVHSPAQYGTSKDPRRLGVAIRKVLVEK